jgi:hypothetical protein
MDNRKASGASCSSSHLLGAKAVAEADQTLEVDRRQGEGLIHGGPAKPIEPIELVSFRYREPTGDVLSDQLPAATIQHIESLGSDIG